MSNPSRGTLNDTEWDHWWKWANGPFQHTLAHEQFCILKLLVALKYGGPAPVDEPRV